MIPGITAYGGILAPSAPASFKGVATLTTDGLIEVFQDNGSSYTSVFQLSDSFAIDVHMGAVDLLVRRSSVPYIRVYSWNGTTFAQTWEGINSGGIPNGSSISYDGNRIFVNAANNCYIYKRSGASYAAEYNLNGPNPVSSGMNYDGSMILANPGSNETLFRLAYTAGAWATAWNTVSGTNYGTHQTAMSRAPTAANPLYIFATTMSTSSPYVQMYRGTLSTGVWTRLGNVPTLPPFTWTLKGVDISYDGTQVVVGYQAGTTTNGGVRIYQQSTATVYGTVALDTGAIANGNVGGVSFNSTGDKIFVGRAYASAGADKIWVWTKIGGTWTQTASINASGFFAPTLTTRRCISAN